MTNFNNEILFTSSPLPFSLMFLSALFFDLASLSLLFRYFIAFLYALCIFSCVPYLVSVPSE